MDVRCDRCQTEYELDDESVAGAGASVQCTTCGHTFVVTRSGSMTIGTATTPPGGIAAPEASPSQGGGPRPSQTGSTPPPVPEWVLATEEGQTHRLRDLTTLQKWIVERRVSRVDRVSHRGGAWRPLGDLEELRPFFDVVEQADRQTGGARAAEPARSVRPTMPATPRKVQSPVRSHVSADLDDDDVLSSSSGRGDGGRFMDSDIGSDDDLSLALRPRRTGLKIAGALAVVGLAGAAWYLGFRDPHGFRLASGAPIVAPEPTATATPVGPAPVAAPAPAAAAAPVVAAAPTSADAAVAAAPPTPALPPLPAAPAPAPVAAAAPEKVPAAPAAPSGDAAKPAAASSHASADGDSKPKSYERLVEDADQALENGQTAKAQKMYDEALRLQPNGVAAQTGSAYLLMDKRRPLAAIGLFKQALSYAPNYAPALFGLGEAYRSQGNAAEAIDAYKRYLEQSPTGTDAPAARRQIKDLGEAAAAPHNTGPSAVIPDNAEMAAPSPSPTSPPPSTPPPLN